MKRKLAIIVVECHFLWLLIVCLAGVFRSRRCVRHIFGRLLHLKIESVGSVIVERIATLAPRLIVDSGPFAGMIYPQLRSAGSMLAPKILGTYESEISGLFTPEYLRQFSAVFDVGCAEGYYAIGVGLLNKNCDIHAYDTSFDAREMCLEMARANGVSERIKMHERFTAESLGDFSGKRALFISDCEGFEMEIFTKDNWAGFGLVDVIVEVHEHLGANLNTLIERFSVSHDVSVIYPLSDIEKSLFYRSALLGNLSVADRILFFCECRQAVTPWIVARARINA